MLTRFLGGRAVVAAALAGALFALACNDAPTSTSKPSMIPVGKVAVYANLAAASGVNALVIDVSGPGIVKSDGTTPDTLVFNIPMSNGTASGSISIPAGSQRVITAHAFSDVTETHRGSVTVDIVEGVNPTIAITLVPLVGDVPLTVSIGTTIVTVFPTVATLAVGDTLRFSAEVHDNNGNLVSGAAVRWATLNPVRATIDSAGLVTMHDTGTVQIVATYGTVGGSAKVTGTSVTSSNAFELTWNGSVSQDWNDPLNWDPHGIGAQRVPTLSDSVVIPGGTPRSPRVSFDCSTGDVSVKALDIQLGGGLGTYCDYGVNVYGSAVIRGADSTKVFARPGAHLAGTFDRLYIWGDTVRLIDSVRANYVEVNNVATAGLILNGHTLRVDGDFNIYQGTVTLADPDTLVVAGNVYWAGANNTGKLTGGTVLFRGTDFNGYRYNASGTNKLVLDRTGSGVQRLDGFNYGDPTQGALQKLEIRDSTSFCGYIAIADTVTIAEPGHPINVTGCGYTVRAYGPVITSDSTSVSNNQWELRHSTGTSLVSGVWSPQYTDLYVANAPVKPGLGYVNLRFYASNQFTGPTTATGFMYVGGTGTDVALNGQKVTVGGYFQVDDGNTVTMNNAADSLLVAEYVAFNNYNQRAAEQTKLTAGVLRVGAYLYGNGFNASGTHLVEMAGTSADQHYISGIDYPSYGEGFANLEIDSGATYGICSAVKVRSTLTVRANATITQQCGGYPLRVEGKLFTEAASTVSTYQMVLADTNGTAGVNGAWSPSYTDFSLANAPVKAGLGYQNLRFYAANKLLGPTTATGYVELSGATTDLDLNGTSLGIGSYLNLGGNSSTLTMTHAADSLEVAGYVNFGSNTSTAELSKLTAGVMRVGGYLYGYGFSASGTHRVVFTGITGDRYISGMDYSGRPGQGFQNLELADGTAYGLCNSVDVKGTTTLHGTAALGNWCTNPTVRFNGDVVADAGSTINSYSVVLNNTQGTTNVAGIFAPTWTTISTTAAGGALKTGLGYTNMAFAAPVTLSDSLRVNGDLQVNGSTANLTLNGHTVHVTGNLDLNSNSLVTMANAADSLIVEGDERWDGGSSENGHLTAGVNIARGALFYGYNYYGTGTHTTVFDRTGGTTSIQGMGSAPASQQFNDVRVQGQSGGGISIYCYMVAAGNVSVATGSRIDPICTPSNLYVTKVLSADQGSAITNGASYPNSQSLAVILYDSTGTRDVFGQFDPSATYFEGTAAHINPALQYRYMRIGQSTTLLDSTTVNGQLDIINSAILTLGGHKLVVNGTLNFDNSAKLRMTNALDTVYVGVTDPTADLFWDGGDNSTDGTSALLTAGAVKFYGDRLYGYQYKPQAGSRHRFIFAANTGGGNASVSVETNPTFAEMEIAGNKPVAINNSATVGDSLIISSPTQLSVVSDLYVKGELVTGRLSEVTGGNVHLYGPGGTHGVLGSFHPTFTGFYALSPAADAINPVLGYNNVELKGQYQLSGATTFAGYLDIDNTSATPGSANLVLNSLPLHVGQSVDMWNGGQIQMLNAADSLFVGDFFRIQSSAGTSSMSDGVLLVAGNYEIDRDGNSSTGTHKIVLNGTGGAGLTQYINTGGTLGQRDMNTVDITGTRTINIQRELQVNGTFSDTTSTAPITSNYTVHFKGPVYTGAAVGMTFSGTTEFANSQGTAGIGGTYKSTGTTRFSGIDESFNSALTYTDVDITGFVSPTVKFSLLGNLSVQSGASFNVPTGSTVAGNTYVYGGTLDYSGGAVTNGDLYVYNTATAAALGTGGVDFIDFHNIFLYSGGTINNTSPPGFRYLTGQTPTIQGTLTNPLGTH